MKAIFDSSAGNLQAFWEVLERKWTLVLPSGDSQVGSRQESLGLPGLKVNVRQEDCRWERAVFPDLWWLLGPGLSQRRGESEPGASFAPPHVGVGETFLVGPGGVNFAKNNWGPRHLGLK